MTTTADQPSSTPILDLAKPFPRPCGEHTTGRLAAPFLGAVAFIVMTENYASLVVPFGMVLIAFLSIVVHELGHLVAGWSVGWRFDGVTMGPIVIKRSRSGWSFRLTRYVWRGLTFMSFTRISRLRRKLITFGLGGPIASLACGGVALIGGEIVTGELGSLKLQSEPILQSCSRPLQRAGFRFGPTDIFHPQFSWSWHAVAHKVPKTALSGFL